MGVTSQFRKGDATGLEYACFMEGFRALLLIILVFSPFSNILLVIMDQNTT